MLSFDQSVELEPSVRIAGFSEKVIHCPNFTIYPRSYFYPIYFENWPDFFNEYKAPSTMTKLEASLAVHVWNYVSEREPVQLKSQQPYAQLARRYCPRISNLAENTF